MCRVSQVYEENNLEAVTALDKVEQLAPQKYANSPEIANLRTVLTHRPPTSLRRSRPRLTATTHLDGSSPIV